MKTKRCLSEVATQDGEKPNYSEVAVNNHKADKGCGDGASNRPLSGSKQETNGESDKQEHARRNCGVWKAGLKRLTEKLRVHRAIGSENSAASEGVRQGKMEVSAGRFHGLASSLLITIASFAVAWQLPLQVFAFFGGLYTAMLGIVMVLPLSGGVANFIRAFRIEVGPSRVVFILVTATFPLFDSSNLEDTRILTVYGLSVTATALLCAFSDALFINDLGLKERENS